jgi:hypothetical protein
MLGWFLVGVSIDGLDALDVTCFERIPDWQTGDPLPFRVEKMCNCWVQRENGLSPKASREKVAPPSGASGIVLSGYGDREYSWEVPLGKGLPIGAIDVL